MASIFNKIVMGEVPCHKLAESEDFLAFLDINPLERGHTLVIPKKETDYIFDLEDDVLAGLHLFAKKVASAIKHAIPCKRVAVAVLGLEVPHAHIHLIPMNDLSATNFMRPKLTLPAIEMEDICNRIRAAMKN